MRLFLAINLSDQLRAGIAAAAAPLRAAAPDVRWTSDAKLHLTLKFLGEQDEARLDEIVQTLQAVASRHTPTEVHVSGVGAFPSFRRPRILWIGVEHSPRLELLAHDIESSFETIGFEPEGRPFRPHITLGRLRERATVEEARALARASKRVAFEDALQLSSIDLMRSMPDGAAYHLMSSAPLSRQER
jgi:2'-5' RNA ligase